MTVQLNDIFDEATTAEEYRKEKADREAKEENQLNKRTDEATGYKYSKQYLANTKHKDTSEIYKKVKDEVKRDNKAVNKVRNKLNNRDFGKNHSDSDIHYAIDAANRHMRRHPQSESSIFESVEFI